MNAAFIACIYNINFSIFIYRYLISYFFYFILSSFIYSRIQNHFLAFFTVALIPILIDASVFITLPSMVPLRFPYSTTFMLLGIVSGYLYNTKRWYLLVLSFIFLCLYSYIGSEYLIPSMTYSIITRTKQKTKISKTFIAGEYYTVGGTKIKLQDSLSKKCTLVECFFVGCLPCEQKISALKKIREAYNDSLLCIVMICNGNATSWGSFINYYKNTSLKGVIFLYDKMSILQKQSIRDYPTELLIGNDKIHFIQTGYDKQSESIYLRNEFIKINTVINANSNN